MHIDSIEAKSTIANVICAKPPFELRNAKFADMMGGPILNQNLNFLRPTIIQCKMPPRSDDAAYLGEIGFGVCGALLLGCEMACVALGGCRSLPKQCTSDLRCDLCYARFPESNVRRRSGQIVVLCVWLFGLAVSRCVRV